MIPQDEPHISQDGVIEQAQGDDGERWEDGIVTRQDDSEEVDTGEGLSLEARTPKYHDCMETVDRRMWWTCMSCKPKSAFLVCS